MLDVFWFMSKIISNFFRVLLKIVLRQCILEFFYLVKYLIKVPFLYQDPLAKNLSDLEKFPTKNVTLPTSKCLKLCNLLQNNYGTYYSVIGYSVLQVVNICRNRSTVLFKLFSFCGSSSLCECLIRYANIFQQIIVDDMLQ